MSLKENAMKCDISRLMVGLALASLMVLSAGCGSSNSTPMPSPTPTPTPQNGTVSVLVSDASTEDWATIGVKVLAISLTPQGGGAPVTVYTAPSQAPWLNLVQLDQLSEILGNTSIPAGTYTAVTLTVSGNSGDILLTTSADPESGFAAAPSTTIPTSQIQILGTAGRPGSLTVPVSLTLDSPLVVSANQNSALDLEFDLSHPAFLVAHVAPGNGTTMWAVNFTGPVRRRRIHDIQRLILRHLYATVTTVSSDNTTLTVTKDYPVLPPTTPETAVTSAQSLPILADSVNGTLFYDLDAKTHSTIHDFSTVASTIVNKYVRVAARYQVDGSLVAVRIWTSSNFASVWLSPEGHVLQVDTTGDVLTVENELGLPVPLTVDANTLFYFRTPSEAQVDANSIGQGTAFLANLVRGFKVHVSVVDPLASPLLAQSVDIEIARFDGSISGTDTNGFTYTRNFRKVADDYIIKLPYISSNTANGSDPQSGTALSGFKWWNFTFPTIVDSGANAVSDFEAATNGQVRFGGTVGQFTAAGQTYATWNDASAPNAWVAPSAVLLPTRVPLGTAASGYASSSFTLSVPGGTLTVPISLSTTSGSGTLVYQVDRTGNLLTISPVDITTSAGQATITTNLVAGTLVKVYGIPQANGSIKAYVVFYFSGMVPASMN
jgi:hypothetical protein